MAQTAEVGGVWSSPVLSCGPNTQAVGRPAAAPGPGAGAAGLVHQGPASYIWLVAVVGTNKMLSDYLCWLLNVSVSIVCVCCSVGLSPAFKSLTLHETVRQKKSVILSVNDEEMHMKNTLKAIKDIESLLKRPPALKSRFWSPHTHLKKHVFILECKYDPSLLQLVFSVHRCVQHSRGGVCSHLSNQSVLGLLSKCDGIMKVEKFDPLSKITWKESGFVFQ